MLNPALRGFYESQGVRNFVLYGGRASSKTYHTAGFCVYLASNYRVKFLCVRQFQNRISDSVKSVIEECIYKLGMQHEFKITENAIEHPGTGSTFTFLGIQRNLKEIKGIAGIDILWIEEAEDLSEDQWEVLEPTIRAECSKVFIVFNPRFSSDFVYKRFVKTPPPETLLRKINYDENPYLSSTMRKIIASAKESDYDDYMHIYEGVPRDDNDACIIQRSWLMTAIDGHIKLDVAPVGTRRMGFDVADSGEDACAMVDAYGSLALWSDLWQGKEDELLMSCSKVWTQARDRRAMIIYDAIGVGAGCGAKFNELNANSGLDVAHQKFFAGGAVINPDKKYGEVLNKDFFANVKAQSWWLVADRLRNTYNAVRNGQKFDVDEMIFLSSEMPHLDKLIDELSTPRKDYDKAGRVKVESKKDLAKRGVPSPNLADAFIQAFSQTLNTDKKWAF